MATFSHSPAPQAQMSATFSYSALGLSEGDFSNYLKFHVDGDNNTTDKIGFFTVNDTSLMLLTLY